MAYNPTYYLPITIDHTKCTGSGISNFPVAVSVTFPGTHGVYPRSDAFDVHFFGDSAGTHRLAAEMESYNSTTHVWIGWINLDASYPLPANTGGSDLTIYVRFGDAAWSTDPNGETTYGKTSVWDANTKCILHLPNGTTLGANDSTANSNNGTIEGATAITGTIDGAASFSGGTFGNNDIKIADNASLSPTNITLSTWINETNRLINRMIIIKNENTNVGAAYGLWINTSGSVMFDIWSAGNWREATSGVNILSTGTTYYISATFDGSVLTIYINGASKGTLNYSGSIAPNSGSSQVRIGDNVSSNAAPWIGSLDEVHISSIARSSSWIASEYANQSNITIGAGKFWSTIGTETAIGGGTSFSAAWIRAPYRVIGGGLR